MANLLAERDKGHKAQTFLDSPTFKEAVASVKEDLWEDFMRIPSNEPGALQHIKQQIEGLNLVLRKLREWADTGKLATKTLENTDGRGG